MTVRRLSADKRRGEILSAAIHLASLYGYTSITRDAIAERAGVSGPAVQYHFGTITELRGAIMRYAVKCRYARVVAQGLAVNDAYALEADDALKKQARGVL